MNTQNTTTSESAPAEPQRGVLAEIFHGLKVSLIATLYLGILVSGVYPLIVWGLSQALFSHQANGSLIDKNGKPAASEADAVGSTLIGQNFSTPQYFHPRPSAAGNGYDPTASGASNLGPMSAKLINGTTKAGTPAPTTRPSDPVVAVPDVVDFDGVHDRIVHYCDDNNIEFDSSIPMAKFKDSSGNYDDVKLIKAFNDGSLTFTPKKEIPADAVTGSGSGLDPHISVANALMQAQRVADARKVSVDKVKTMIAEYTEGPSLGIIGDAGVNVLRVNLALDNDAPTPAAPAAAPSTSPTTQP